MPANRPSSFPSRQRKTIWLPSTHQMPSSGSTSAGGGSSTRHGFGATGHASTVRATSASTSCSIAASLEFVSTAAPTLSSGDMST